MTRFDHVTIVGAGAMGCLFGARLAEAGIGVTLVDADPERLASIRTNGVTLEDDSGRRGIELDARAAGEAGPTDLVMLFTKGMHSEAAIRSVAHLAGASPHAITLQNGLGNAEIIAGVFPPDRILIGATDFPADFSPPATVSSHGKGHIWLGPFGSASPAAALAAAEMFNRAGMAATYDADVAIAIWEKVAFNAALNSLAAITRLRVGGLDTQAGRAIAFAVVDETIATAAAQGLALDASRIRGKIEYVLVHHRGHKASMLQDLEAGRRTEIESINGAVVRAAQAAGVATPVTAALANLLRLIEQPGNQA